MYCVRITEGVRQCEQLSECYFSRYLLPGAADVMQMLVSLPDDAKKWLLCVGYRATDESPEDTQIGFTGTIECSENPETGLCREGVEEVGLNCSNAIRKTYITRDSNYRRSHRSMSSYVSIIDAHKVIPIVDDTHAAFGSIATQSTEYIDPLKHTRKATGLIIGSCDELIRLATKQTLRPDGLDKTNIDRIVIISVTDAMELIKKFSVPYRNVTEKRIKWYASGSIGTVIKSASY